MTTADYALIVSIASAVLSVFALIWNVWQKYIFVRPTLDVGFGVYQIMQRSGPMTMRATQCHELGIRTGHPSLPHMPEAAMVMAVPAPVRIRDPQPYRRRSDDRSAERERAVRRRPASQNGCW